MEGLKQSMLETNKPEKVKAALAFIARGECQVVEFKRKANHPEKIIKEVVAFANSEGGHLFIGVNDDGTVAGLKYPEDEAYVLTKAIEELCRPAIEFTVELIHVGEGVRILHYRIAESRLKPHFAFLATHHKYGKAFVRSADHSIQASYEVRQILKHTGRHTPPVAMDDKVLELMRYLEIHGRITLLEYMHLSGLTKKLASNKLIHLVLSGALKIEPREGGDIFMAVG